jgi:prepilin-type N-terminal cleavage/methylation domain-containing protein
MTRSSHRKRHGDDGVTLVEVIVAIAILGIAGTVIVGAMFTYTNASATHRSQANVQIELRRYAEAVANTAYQTNCAATSYAVTGYTAPTGFTASNAVALWDAATLSFDITPAAGCTDPGLQRVRVTVVASGLYPYSESVDVVKRNPGP